MSQRVVLKAPREFAGAVVDQFTDLFRKAMGEDGRWIEVDLSEVHYMDTIALGRLVRLGTECRERAGELLLANATAEIRDLIAVTRLDEYLFVRHAKTLHADDDTAGDSFLKLVR